tara:strand:- start:1008 stop:1361 length:354 start_codon:yes stop_codon:yes gene_type:complete
MIYKNTVTHMNTHFNNTGSAMKNPCCICSALNNDSELKDSVCFPFNKAFRTTFFFCSEHAEPLEFISSEVSQICVDFLEGKIVSPEDKRKYISERERIEQNTKIYKKILGITQTTKP